MANWHDVAAASDVADDLPLTVKVGDREVGVYSLNGKYYGLEDVYPRLRRGDLPPFRCGRVRDRPAPRRERRARDALNGHFPGDRPWLTRQ
jgi:hypothetical protein